MNRMEWMEIESNFEEEKITVSIDIYISITEELRSSKLSFAEISLLIIACKTIMMKTI